VQIVTRVEFWEAALPEKRLTGTDKRALFLWVALGLIGVWFAHRYFFQAFPEASVEFKVPRGQAQIRAKQFVEGMGENLEGYHSAITFQVDEGAKTYLERELGLQRANQLMSKELNIWYWEVRFFRPLQQEEYQVRVNPAGKIVAYEHKIEEVRAGKSLHREEALVKAEGFLQENLGTDLSNWQFLSEEANSQMRPNRLDWSFTWERKGFRAKEAPYRLEVGLDGDKIGESQEFLQVPEAWTLGYKRLRNGNDTLAFVFAVPYLLLIGAAAWIAIVLSRQGQISWNIPVKIGLVVAALLFLQSLNGWPLWSAQYRTTDSYVSFIAGQIGFALFGALVTAALTITLILPAGEILYRGAQPDRLQLRKAFTLRGVRSQEFFSSAVVGISMAAAHIGFIVAFYMIGSKLGVWAPQELNYENSASTVFPWISGAAIGVTAATSEEFLFRLFAIPFFKRLVRFRWIAVFAPAFLWGFLHSNYPQEPAYIRGLEVGLIGVVAGFVILRWGIVATLIWHYTVDASLVGLLLIRSDNVYFRISGIAVALAAVVPLAYSGVTYLRRGGFEGVDDLLNRAEPAPEVEFSRETTTLEQASAKRRYEPLAAGTIGFLAMCLIVGGLAGWKLKRDHIGDYLRVSVNSRAVVERADAVLREHGVDPKSYYKAAEFVEKMDPVTNEYLRRRISIAEINSIYAERAPGALWLVRYFQDSQPEEFAVTLKPDGSVHAFRHTLAEATKGATLTKEEALVIAGNFLREQKKLDLLLWKLVDSTSEKRPNRTDHTLTWQQEKPLDPGKNGEKDSTDHAYLRMEVQVLGDQAVNYRTFIKIPEYFSREHEKRTLPLMLYFVGRITLFFGLAVIALVFYFKRFRSDPVQVPWRRLVVWGMAGFAAFGISFLLGNGIPDLMGQYQTAFPFRLFFGTQIGLTILQGVFVWGGIVLLFGLAWNYAARAFGEERIPTWLSMPGEYYRDAFWIGLGGAALLVGLRRVIELVATWMPTVHREYPAIFGTAFDALYPAAAVIGGGVLDALLRTGVVALASAFLAAELRVRWLRLVLFWAVAAAMVSNWGSPLDFLERFVGQAIVLGVVVFGIRRVARFNLLGWFLVIACTRLLSGAVELLSQPSEFYRTQGYIVVAALGLLLLWPLLTSKMQPGPGMSEVS
jgi:membrane protease YdiL (CAAX protease family)